MSDDRSPVLIGGGQFTQRTAQEGRFADSLDPIAMMQRASAAAFADTGASDARIAPALDLIAVVQFITDTGEGGGTPKRQWHNPAWSLAQRLGAGPRRTIYTAGGGNTPQALVNAVAEEIANGTCEVALLAGAEYLASLLGAMKKGVALPWPGEQGPDPEGFGTDRRFVTDTERAHGLQFPVNAYPLFENAIRGRAGRTLAAHQQRLGELMAPFTRVAAANPHAWFPTARTAEEIATPAERNRYVGFPYTKYMCAVIEVDQAAALVMTSRARARALGVPEERMIYLHGCAEAHDHWYLLDRVNYWSSPAMAGTLHRALAMAGKTPADMSAFDLYSCFPSAVELACEALGLSHDDPRGLTLTGGLPYFGGPGNNYTMHAIVEMLARLRRDPGRFGLVTANGGYVTKHAAGVYGSVQTQGPWRREAPSVLQREIDAMRHPRSVAEAEGPGTVETYTVVTDRKGQRFGLLIARRGDGARCVAHVTEPALIARMMEEEMVQRPVTLRHEAGKNLASF